LVSRGSRSFALFLTLTMASMPLHAVAQPAPAQSEIDAGDKALRTKDFDAALAHYQASKQASPTSRAQLGIADALYQLGRLGESYEAYNEAQNAYGSKLGAVEKALVAKRMKELAGKTGWLSVRVSESGASVDLDGKPMGTSPVPVLVRVAAGPHEVHIAKPGFTSFDGKVDVGADATAVVDAKLVAAATMGHVVVHASGNEPLRVIVDGVDVGATPWEGDLPAGPHSIAGRSSSAVAEAQQVDLTAGSRTSVDLVSSATAAHLQVRTSDGKGAIFIDGVARGEGAFAGEVAPGAHTVVVTREGYERYEKPITVTERQTWAETVTLNPVAAAGAVAVEGERALAGIYGGFGFMGSFGVAGTGTELETSCSNLGANSCNTPAPAGGGAYGYIGYTWDPVGFELFLAGSADTMKQTATFTGQTANGNALLPSSMPARTEDFTFVRVGGTAAVRARAVFQNRRIRGTIAGGVGLSFREIAMQRIATLSDGSGANIKTVPNGVGYVSPAISIEGGVQLRLTQTLGVVVGAQFIAENASIAGQNQTSAQAPCSSAGQSNCTPPLGGSAIQTPAYHLASGPQVMIGPFVGLAFGP
jgi:hypothetical protein